MFCELVLTSVASLPVPLFLFTTALFSKKLRGSFSIFFLRVGVDSEMLVLLQAEPPTIVVATMGSLCQMLEKHILKLDSCQVLVVDEVIKMHFLSYIFLCLC